MSDRRALHGRCHPRSAARRERHRHGGKLPFPKKREINRRGPGIIDWQRRLRPGRAVHLHEGRYLPFDGAPPRDVRRYVEETFVKPGIAGFEDFVGGSHCMTPAYLQHQLDQSLQNLKLNCVDVYYVHNPESQLDHVSEEEFYRRLRAAFESLEKSRGEGKLKFYGVATWNGFRVPAGARGYHSLARMETVAREVGGDAHGFRFVQLPLNLAMPEAFTLRNQRVNGEDVSTLEAAAALNITAVASASILQGRVARGLPPGLREPLGSLATDAQMAIQFVRSTPGITTALVGMSSPEHVAENLQLVRSGSVGALEVHADVFRVVRQTLVCRFPLVTVVHATTN